MIFTLTVLAQLLSLGHTDWSKQIITAVVNYVVFSKYKEKVHSSIPTQKQKNQTILQIKILCDRQSKFRSRTIEKQCNAVSTLQFNRLNWSSSLVEQLKYPHVHDKTAFTLAYKMLRISVKRQCEWLFAIRCV